MKRSLMFAAAISAFVVPAVAPLTASAQDAPLFRSREDVRAARRAETEAARAAEPAPAPAPPRQERREERQERREDRQESAETAPNPPATQAATENRQDRRENRLERREDRQEQRQDRQELRQDRQENREDSAQANPDQPLFRSRQDVIDARAAEARGETWRGPQNDRPQRREDRQDRREYREFHQRFSGDHWRRDNARRFNSGWWRNDRRFRGYNGIRAGFYFAPNYGYYQVPRQYLGQRYYEGRRLPSIFWRYSLDDWRTFGLGYPPQGTRWVLVDNHIYLIDAYDGYIIDVIYDAWRW